ncbi:MAG: hypothetical protein IJS68_03975 [Clostridia bacterium]|nr:hypothetical protein [Clostridia bacterium]
MSLKKLLPYFLSSIILAIILLLITNPQKYTSSVISGFLLFANCVFPGLFPFLILTKILTDLKVANRLSARLQNPMQKVFKIPGIACYIFLMAALCGYPIGAKITADLEQNGIINKSQTMKVLSLCAVSGPMFTIGAIGSAMFGSVKIGAIIYLAHILSSLLFGFIYCNLKSKDFSQNPPQQTTNYIVNYDTLLSNSVYGAISSILIVGGYITIFFMLIEMVSATHILFPLEAFFKAIFGILKINQNLAQPFCHGLLEITRGINEISKFSTTPITISLSAGLVSFSGLSIILQSLAFAGKSGLKFGGFILQKFFNAIITILICYALCLFLI